MQHTGSFTAGYRFLWCIGSVVEVHGLSCSTACRLLVSPPGIKPISPTWQDRFLTTGPLGKSPYSLFSNISERQGSEMALQSCQTGQTGQFRIRGSSPQFGQDALCSMCSREPQAGLQNISADGWFLTSIILAPLFVLCSPLKMWFLPEADALVHMVLLRINP